jgi:hypothetical protein
MRWFKSMEGQEACLLYGLSAETGTRFNKKNLGRPECECGVYRGGTFAGSGKNRQIATMGFWGLNVRVQKVRAGDGNCRPLQEYVQYVGQ